MYKKFFFIIMSLVLFSLPELVFRSFSSTILYFINPSSEKIITTYHNMGWFGIIVFITQMIGLVAVVAFFLAIFEKKEATIDKLLSFLPAILIYLLSFIIVSIVIFIVSFQNVGF